MTLELDPEIRAALGNPTTGQPGPPVGDVETRRRNLTAGMAAAAAGWKPVAGVDRTDLTITTADGYALPAQWYQGADTEKPTGAVLFLHGGAMILPLLPIYDSVARMYVQATGVAVLLIDYRVAPEHPDPTPVEDCYAALRWLAEHGTELGVDYGLTVSCYQADDEGRACGLCDACRREHPRRDVSRAFRAVVARVQRTPQGAGAVRTQCSGRQLRPHRMQHRHCGRRRRRTRRIPRHSRASDHHRLDGDSRSLRRMAAGRHRR